MFSSYALPLTLLVVFINILLASWNILHGDLRFNADIARDFLLYDELSQKGIILIGPRASGLSGLFHGPLWIYLNYPAYVIGQGNPIVVGYFWILLNILFLGISYFVASKLFNKSVAYVYVILLSGAMIFFLDSLFNPFGAMLVMPLLLFFIVRYTHTLHWKYFAGCLLVLGAIIQFQMAIGLPLLLLTGLYSGYIILKNKKYLHILLFLLLLLPFSTYLVFELRHNFQQTTAILNMLQGQNSGPFVPYLDRIGNRWEHMTSGIYFSQVWSFSLILNNIIACIFAVFLYMRLFIKENRKDKKRLVFALLLYFYVGFYLLSLFLNGRLLYHYTFPLIPLTFLLFSSMILYFNKKIFLGLLLVVVFANYSAVNSFLHERTLDRNAAFTSWLFHKEVAEKVFQSEDNNFGYFIYAPDYYAYAPKYAFAYVRSLYDEKKVFLFEKKSITYTVEEPAPPDRLDLTSDYWITSQVKLTSKPVKEYTFRNGYKVKKYVLTESELASPIDPIAADWLHYR